LKRLKQERQKWLGQIIDEQECSEEEKMDRLARKTLNCHVGFVGFDGFEE
jgi:hypothetical protein